MVLDRKEYLPPLCLKFFEEYLLFVEFGPENLLVVSQTIYRSVYLRLHRYYELWFRDYRSLYSDMESTTIGSRKKILAMHLSMSFARARTTFFMPGAEYELNIPVDSRVSILLSTQPTSFTSDHAPPLPPNQLKAINREVGHQLESSFQRFKSWSQENAGPMWFGTARVCGTMLMLTAFVPLLVELCEGQTSRYLRLLGCLPLLVGSIAVYASYSKVLLHCCSAFHLDPDSFCVNRSAF